MTLGRADEAQGGEPLDDQLLAAGVVRGDGPAPDQRFAEGADRLDGLGHAASGDWSRLS